MVSNTIAPVLQLIEQAAKIYKCLYGEYPEAVGLDVFSRFEEWRETPYFDHYFFYEMNPAPLGWDARELTFRKVAVRVDPATFSPIRYNSFGLDPHPSNPVQGMNGVWCKRGEHEAAIDLLITKSGYHAAIGEKSDWQEWKEYESLVTRDE